MTPRKQWPKVSRNVSDIARMGMKRPVFGLDFEWDTYTLKPTILGVSDGETTVSAPFEEALPHFKALAARFPKANYVGHNFLQAELPILTEHGVHIEPAQVKDTIILFWLTHPHLCKSTRKAVDESERRGAGYMNMWSMLSLTTDAACHKYCRESVCEGPCPAHDVWGYNGLDAREPIFAADHLERLAKLRGVDSLYPLHRDLAVQLHAMSKAGVLIDKPYVEGLQAEFDREKLIYWNPDAPEKSMLPFNPRSVPAVKEYFKKLGIKLKNNQEATIRKAVEEDENENETLLALLAYKELGNGTDRWFAPLRWDSKKKEWTGFMDESGRVHPRLNFFTSTARMMCVDPNMQNVAKRRIDRKTGENVGQKIRRAVIAPPGYYIYKADYSNAENRVMLYYGGYDIPFGLDLHDWVRELSEIKDTDEFAQRIGGKRPAREAAKSIQHAGNYMEGLVLLHPADLKSRKIQAEVTAGARLVYPDWKFEDKVVSFTGINLSRRAFGDASIANRIKALAITQKYFGRFEGVRDAQRRIMKQCEQGFVRPPHGYTMLSYGYQEDRIKQAAATWGSQPVAHMTKLALRNSLSNPNVQAILQVHDELLFLVDCRFEPKQVKGWLEEIMCVETPEMPGFRLPIDVSYGKTWADQTKI